MKNVGGSIPCEGCHKNIVRGIVYKIGEESFLCNSCYHTAVEMETTPDNKLEQYKEKES